MRNLDKEGILGSCDLETRDRVGQSILSSTAEPDPPMVPPDKGATCTLEYGFWPANDQEICVYRTMPPVIWHFRISPNHKANPTVPILTTPTYGELTALALVNQLKIESQKGTQHLAEAKEIACKEGFYQDTMLVGEFKGPPVTKPKPKSQAG